MRALNVIPDLLYILEIVRNLSATRTHGYYLVKFQAHVLSNACFIPFILFS